MVTPNEHSVPEADPETVAVAAAWARTTDFAWPLQWGQIEDDVMDLPLPPAGAGKAGAIVQGALGSLSAALVGGASLIGLALLLVLRGSEDKEVQDLSGTGALFAFIVALGAVVAAAYIWWDTGRRRSPLGLGVSATTGVVSAIAFIVFQGMSYDDDRNTLLINLLTAAAAVVGVGLFGAILLGSKDGAAQSRRRPFSLDMGKELQLIDARNAVLDVLVERHLARVDAKEKERIASMPLGSWHQLDRQKD